MAGTGKLGPDVAGVWLISLVAVAALAAGCGKVTAAPDGSEPDAPMAGGADAGHADALLAADAATRCNATAPFGTPALVAGLENTANVGSPRLSPDELTMYFHGTPTNLSVSNLWVSTRSATDQPFSAPTELTTVDSTSHNDFNPSVSSDGLLLVFNSDRAAGEGFHIYGASRSSTVGDFGAPTEVANVNSATVTDHDLSPFLSADGQALWFASNRAGGSGGIDIYEATKSGAGFGNPDDVAALNSPQQDVNPVVSADGLTVYFESDRPGGQGQIDIWRAHRNSTAGTFSTPKPVTELDSTANDYPGWLSADSCRFYFSSDRAGSEQIYVAIRQP